MKNPADTRRITLARRLACNLPAWAVARASVVMFEARATAQAGRLQASRRARVMRRVSAGFFIGRRMAQR